MNLRILIPAALAALVVAIAGPAQTVQLPVATIVSQVHNAPGWLPATSYTYTATRPYTRVNAGAGWNPTTKTWNPGQPLAAYQLDASSPVPCTSSATGSGPSGIGQLIADGTCKWDYLSSTDYVTLTGWSFDNQRWVSGTHYGIGDVVTAGSPLWAYGQVNPAGCTSTTQPTGTTGTAGISTATLGVDWMGFSYNTYADSCWWVPMAQIGYSSERSFIPTQTYTASQTYNVNMHFGYEAELWDDAVYSAGVNGEHAPLETMFHNGYGSEGASLTGCRTGMNPPICPQIIITPAPGEGFRDILTPSSPLTFPNAANGVMLYSDSTISYPSEPAGFAEWDNSTDLIGLQIKSVNGSAVAGEATYNNSPLVLDCILEADGANGAVVSTDTSNVIANSLLIANGSLIGISEKYPGFIVHDTIVSPGKTGAVCLQLNNQWVFNPTVVSDTACLGFSHMAAYNTSAFGGTAWASTSLHNVTDAPVGDSGTTTWYGQGPGGTGATVNTVPGTTYGISDSGMFQNFASDWRNPGSGALYGTGAPVGYFESGCTTASPNCPYQITYNFDTPDVIGTTRPQPHGTDIGAWEHTP